MEQQVSVASGVSLHVRMARPDKPSGRCVLVLPGSLVTNDSVMCPLDDAGGGHALELAARSGFVALCPSYAGYGQSTKPSDGKTVTFQAMLAHMAGLLEWARRNFEVPRIDIVGSSIGSLLAVELADCAEVGALVLSSVVYKDVSPALRDAMLSSGMREAFLNAPHGYVQTAPPHYQMLMQRCTSTISQWALKTFPGTYAVGPTLEGFRLPLANAASARKPAMLVWGERDPLTPRSDVQTFEREYGGPLRLHVIPEGCHAPMLEPERQSFWQAALNFVAHASA